MFDNSGEKLQSWAKRLFVLNVIAFLILAVVFGWERYGYHSEFRPAVFFAFAILGPIISYFESLAMYAFGELAENSSMIKKNTAKNPETKTGNPSGFYN